MTAQASNAVAAANQRTVARLLLLTVAMFGFGFALIPLYDVFCAITGINGKTGRLEEAAAAAMEVDTGRTIMVEFVTSTAPTLPWRFAPAVARMTVHPGQLAEATFTVENRSQRAIVGQAVPSVAPGNAARYFNKTECFCFTRQVVGAGETVQMPVRFIVDPILPAEIGIITLSYTFFELPDAEPADPSVSGVTARDVEPRTTTESI